MHCWVKAPGMRRLSPCLTKVRGLGLMLAVDVVDRDGRLDPNRCEVIIQAAFGRGLLLLGCGKSAVRFCPSLCVTEQEVTTALEILATTCAEPDNGIAATRN